MRNHVEGAGTRRATQYNRCPLRFSLWEGPATALRMRTSCKNSSPSCRPSRRLRDAALSVACSCPPRLRAGRRMRVAGAGPGAAGGAQPGCADTPRGIERAGSRRRRDRHRRGIAQEPGHVALEPRPPGGSGGRAHRPTGRPRRGAGHGAARGGGPGRRCTPGLAGNACAADPRAGARLRGSPGIDHHRRAGRRQAGRDGAALGLSGQRLCGQPCGFAAGALRRAHRRAPRRGWRAPARARAGPGGAAVVFDVVAGAARVRRPARGAARGGRARAAGSRRVAPALPAAGGLVRDPARAGGTQGRRRCAAGPRPVRADRLVGRGPERLRRHAAAAGDRGRTGSRADDGRAAGGRAPPRHRLARALPGAVGRGTDGRRIAAGRGPALRHPRRPGGLAGARGRLAGLVRGRFRQRLEPRRVASHSRPHRFRGHVDRAGFRRNAAGFAAHHEHAVALCRGARAQAAGQAGAGAHACALAPGDHRARCRHGGLHEAHGRIVAGSQREPDHRIPGSHHRTGAGQRRHPRPLHRATG